MLQINTGKLYTTGIGRTNQLRGVLYTNLKLPWRDDIVTTCGTLRSTDGRKGSQALVYELEEHMEQGEEAPGIIVSHSVEPYLQDFSAVASFALNAIVTPDPELTAQLVSGQPGLSSYHPPAQFIRRCFDPELYVQEIEAKELVDFCEQLVGLERRVFLAAMRAIKTYVSGIHRIRDDLGLAYTLMVSAIESLAQDFDEYSSSWDDVDDRKRRPIDAALESVASDAADTVRSAILSVEHLSIGRRYREFVLSHIDESYYRTGDALVGHPIAQCELVEALRQAYSLRSKYVHLLHTLPNEVMLPHGHSEVSYVDRQPTLTFQGLSRLTRHVIRSFVRRGPKLEREVYDYSLERSGVILGKLSPQYWVGHRMVSSKEIRRRLEGFLQQLVARETHIPGSQLTDLSPLLADVERLIAQAPKADRAAMAVLHILFNINVHADDRTPNCDQVHETLGKYIEAPSGEALVLLCYAIDPSAHWDLQKHHQGHDDFFKKRSKPSGLQIPRLFEAAITLTLAERYRSTGNMEQSRALLSFAVSNNPGHQGLLSAEKSFKGDDALQWREILIPRLVDDPLDGQQTSQP
ncbi:hypothetical protein [Pseudomonas veronii]|uniref:hypothetical protein n=1 Tax=Pseudomonas veronii TaxID=76761 RepID=UPI0009A4E399|nr:hypothetical protein [Pseudomonas veronii]AQY66433.1 hypothetical protein PverR02_15725 [Pseudomonas veronii]